MIPYDALCNSARLNRQLKQIRHNQLKDLEKNGKKFSRERVTAKNGECVKLAFYYTKKNGDRVLVACRDLNADIVRYYIAQWTTKYTAIYSSLRNFLDNDNLQSYCEFREVYDIEKTFNDM